MLPMAIEKDVIMAVSSSTSGKSSTSQDGVKVEISNLNSFKFPKRTFHHIPLVHCNIDSTEHEWSNYFKCGYKGILDELKTVKAKNLQILMDGSVPAGGGLSSRFYLVILVLRLFVVLHWLHWLLMTRK